MEKGKHVASVIKIGTGSAQYQKKIVAWWIDALPIKINTLEKYQIVFQAIPNDTVVASHIVWSEYFGFEIFYKPER